MDQYDCLVVADKRFSGGSTSALATDVTAMSALGLRVGLVFVRSAYLDDNRDPPNPKAEQLIELPGVTLHSLTRPAHAKLAFLHHPLVFARGIEERGRLSADRAVIVAHHLPFRPDGSLEYNPVEAVRKARSALGFQAWIAPVSGLVRAQTAAFAPLVRMTSVDWPNVFDVSEWFPVRPPFEDGRPVVIGRHGRVDMLKFSATARAIDASLPAGPDIRVRVLGCPTEELTKCGAHPDRWDVLAFGAEPVPEFLNSLDVFVYHFHPNLDEAFGRTVVEAGLCGRPLLLDPRLKQTFGGLARYCPPEAVRDEVMQLAADPAAARARAAEVRDAFIAEFAAESLENRLDVIAQDAGTTSRNSAVASPAKVLRKLTGHYRRRLSGATG